MTKAARGGKLYPLFTLLPDNRRAGAGSVRQMGVAMVALAAMMFMGLFGFGASLNRPFGPTTSGVPSVA